MLPRVDSNLLLINYACGVVRILHKTVFSSITLMRQGLILLENVCCPVEEKLGHPATEEMERPCWCSECQGQMLRASCRIMEMACLEWWGKLLGSVTFNWPLCWFGKLSFLAKQCHTYCCIGESSTWAKATQQIPSVCNLIVSLSHALAGN